MITMLLYVPHCVTSAHLFPRLWYSKSFAAMELDDDTTKEAINDNISGRVHSSPQSYPLWQGGKLGPSGRLGPRRIPSRRESAGAGAGHRPLLWTGLPRSH